MNAPHGWRKAATLTLTEAAAVIREETGERGSRSLVYEWAKAGRIPTHSDRQQRLRVRTADLVALMATMHQAVEAPQEALFDLGGGESL